MKKKIFFLIYLIVMILYSTKAYALTNASGDYLNYASLNMKEGRIVRNYKSKELEDEILKTKNRRFRGWNIITFNENAEVEFISQMLFSVHNDGTSSIDYTYDLQSQTTSKTQFSTTGTISYNVNGKVKTITNKLDAQVKISQSYEETYLVKESEKLVIKIDPGTLCVAYIEGKGLITNGVARYYELWMEQHRGSFEFFTITDAHLRIEKIRL